MIRNILVISEDTEKISISSIDDKPLNIISTNDSIITIVSGNWPDPSQVIAGVVYGPTGTDYVGTAIL